MTNLETFREQLRTAQSVTRAADANARAAGKLVQEARAEEHRLAALVKIAESKTDQAAEQVERVHTQLAERIAARLTKAPLTFPHRTTAWASARVKGGWETSVNAWSNLRLLPADGAGPYDAVRAYNEEAGTDYEYDSYCEDELPSDLTETWIYRAPAGEAAEAKIVATVWRRPTGMAEGAQLVAEGTYEIAFDPAGELPGVDVQTKAFEQAFAACVAQPLRAIRHELAEALAR